MGLFFQSCLFLRPIPDATCPACPRPISAAVRSTATTMSPWTCCPRQGSRFLAIKRGVGKKGVVHTHALGLLRLALAQVLRCKAGGFVMIAIDCSSFSCMLLGCLKSHLSVSSHKKVTRHVRSRWTSGRTHVKPEGHTGYNFVSAGNTLCARVALILYVAAWRGLRWAIEQPRTSFLPNMPRLQQIWRHMEACLLKLQSVLRFAHNCAP